MSNKMERIVGKAVLDAAFREALIANPEAALAEADLTLGAKKLEELKAGIERYKQDSEAQAFLANTAGTTARGDYWRG
ncbi:MAG: hypothetical protein IPL28_16360 [Chloroflexi bacterium]|nr:hypothetical protein [Chloroflexota bacterium]